MISQDDQGKLINIPAFYIEHQSIWYVKIENKVYLQNNIMEKSLKIQLFPII